MLSPLLAADWSDLIKVAPFIVAILVWVINQFASKVQPPAPPKPHHRR